MFTIECREILLREFDMADLETFHALTWQPEIYETLPGWNVSKEQRETWLKDFEIPDNRRFLHAVSVDGKVGGLRLRLGMVLRASGELIGWCCTGIKHELPPPNREIVFAISNDHRGRGYTTQAAQALIAYLFEHTNVEELHAIALVRNIPSNRVIQKCGFEFQKNMDIDDERYMVYKLCKSAWEINH